MPSLSSPNPCSPHLISLFYFPRGLSSISVIAPFTLFCNYLWNSSVPGFSILRKNVTTFHSVSHPKRSCPPWALYSEGSLSHFPSQRVSGSSRLGHRWTNWVLASSCYCGQWLVADWSLIALKFKLAAIMLCRRDMKTWRRVLLLSLLPGWSSLVTSWEECCFPWWNVHWGMEASGWDRGNDWVSSQSTSHCVSRLTPGIWVGVCSSEKLHCWSLKERWYEVVDMNIWVLACLICVCTYTYIYTKPGKGIWKKYRTCWVSFLHLCWESWHPSICGSHSLD